MSRASLDARADYHEEHKGEQPGSMGLRAPLVWTLCSLVLHVLRYEQLAAPRGRSHFPRTFG